MNGLLSIRVYKVYDWMVKINGKLVDNNIRFIFVNIICNCWFIIRLEIFGGVMIWLIVIFVVMRSSNIEN